MKNQLITEKAAYPALFDKYWFWTQYDVETIDLPLQFLHPDKENFLLELTFDSYFQQIECKIWADPKQEEKKFQCGEIRLFVVDYALMCEHNEDLVLVADYRSLCTLDIVNAIYDSEEDYFKGDLACMDVEKFIIIDKILIHSDFSGASIGELAIKQAIGLYGHKCAFAVLKAVPLQFQVNITEEDRKDKYALRKRESNFKKAEKSLYACYLKMGFELASKYVGKTYDKSDGEFFIMEINP